MSKLLLISEGDMPTVSDMRSYWTSLPVDYGIEARFHFLADITRGDIDWCDVVMFIRPNDILSWRVAKYAREAGCFVVTFCDDDLLNLPKSMPTIPWRRQGLLNTLHHSDALLTTSPYLAENWKQYTRGERSVVGHTVVREEELANRGFSEARNGPVRLVYAAGGGHALLFEQYVRPALPALIERFRGQIELTFVGVHPDVSDWEQLMPIRYVKGMPLAEYRAFMEKEQFDVGLAPLGNDVFSKCKYFNKFFEYTLSGVVGIYSNVEPYTFIVKDGENGFLADNTSESWVERISVAIENARLRVSCAENARRLVREQFNERKLMNDLLEELPELTHSTERKACCRSFANARLLYFLSRPLDWTYLAIFYLCHNGLRAVFEKICIHLTGNHAYSRKHRKILKGNVL